MKLQTLFVALGLGIALALSCQAGDENIEKALRDLDAQWSDAAKAKDLDKTVSYYANNAIVQAPNHKTATTAAEIRAIWKEALEAENSWESDRVQVAKSGDMAWMSGTYEATTKDASGKTTTEHGKYLEVWEKQADGSWKCTADAWNADTPAEP